jgi:hypothetical protein
LGSGDRVSSIGSSPSDTTVVGTKTVSIKRESDTLLGGKRLWPGPLIYATKQRHKITVTISFIHSHSFTF